MEAPTPYLMGLHSAVSIEGRYLEGVVLVDLDNNTVTGHEPMPPLLQPDGGRLKEHIRYALNPQKQSYIHRTQM